MAEGFARHLGNGRVEAWSAGIIAAGVHEKALLVMKEAGVDISGQRSKTIDDIPLEQMDLVVTLCENAKQTCPNVPARVRKVHISVIDPVGAQGATEDIIADFRRARDEIRAIVSRMLEELESGIA